MTCQSSGRTSGGDSTQDGSAFGFEAGAAQRRPHGGGDTLVAFDIEWLGSGSAGVDGPAASPFVRPVAGEIFSGLVEVVGNDLDGGVAAGAAHGDVGKFPSTTVVEAVGDVDGVALRAVVAAGCGLRQGEVFGLRVCDVDFLRRQLHVEQQVKLLHGKVVLDRPKGGKTRAVPLPTSVAGELAAHLQRHPAQADALLFTSREDKPINRSHFDPYIWHRALAAVGVEQPPERHARPPALLRLGPHRRRRVGQGGGRVSRSC